MNIALRLRTSLVITLILGFASPGHLVAQQGKGTQASRNQGKTPPRLTAQEELEALREGTLGLYDKKLSPEEMELRQDITTMRDSLVVVKGYATRLSQALRTGMASVAVSALKELGPACSNAEETVERLRPNVKALRLRANEPKGQQRYDKVLQNYRSAFEATSNKLITCRSQAGTLALSKPFNTARAAALSNDLQEAILAYESVSRGLLTEFGIPLKPRQLEKQTEKK